MVIFPFKVRKNMRVLCLLALGIFVSPLVWAGNLGSDDFFIRTQAEKSLDEIIGGLRTSNYHRYIHDFHPDLCKKITEAYFKKAVARLRSRIGVYQYRDYMGFVTKGETTLVFWKAHFSKSSDDMIIILTLSREAGIVFVKDIRFNKP